MLSRSGLPRLPERREPMSTSGTIAGIVQEAKGELVESATVVVIGGSYPVCCIAATTSTDGAFHFSGMPVECYRLEALAKGTIAKADTSVGCAVPAQLEIRPP